MEELVALFGHNNVLLFSESEHIPGHELRIVVKNHFLRGKDENQRGVTYYILDKEYNIKSTLMSQSWEALSVWFKIFRKQEIVGTYDFENNSVTLKTNKNG